MAKIKSIFQEVMEEDNSIFANADYFNIEYIPDVIQCRDKQLRGILMDIKPLITNNRSINTIIMGNTSTGKTTVIKHVIREIEEHTNLITCYINCNIQDTIRKCYYMMYEILFARKARNNVSTEILKESVMEKLEEISFVLVIDDINYLSRNESNKLINELFRANEFYHSNMAIIITFNDPLFRYSLEKNASSILEGHEIEFKDYTQEEAYKILKYRCDRGFRNGVILDEQIKRISYNINKVSLRKIISMIYVMGKRVEAENRDYITNEDVDQICI